MTTAQRLFHKAIQLERRAQLLRIAMCSVERTTATCGEAKRVAKERVGTTLEGIEGLVEEIRGLIG